MKRPAFQFYFRDWLTDPSLRSCSIAARGLWIDCMAIMAEAVPYGYLAVNGKGILPTVLARRVGESLADVEAWLSELESHDVFSRTPEGILFSRRMVRDEHNRQVRAAGGVKSLENPNVPRPKDGGEGYPPDDPPPPSSRPSPAVAVASALAVPSNQSPAVAAFIAALPPTQNRSRWLAAIEGWSKGQGLNGLKAATAEEIATGLTEYLLQSDRDFSPAHVKGFIERARTGRVRAAARATAGATPELLSHAAWLVDMIGKLGLAQSRPVESHYALIAKAATDGRIPDSALFRREFDAVRHLSERIKNANAFERDRLIPEIARLIAPLQRPEAA